MEEYRFTETLEKYISKKDLDLVLDLAAYSIISENNAGQYYPDYAYNHPLFSDGMHIYSDSKVSEFSLMLCVPVWRKQRVVYLAVPLGYRMCKKEASKPELAASMVRQVMPSLSVPKNVIILCDSWYAKKDLVSVVDEFANLDIICNARYDSVIYDLAPQPTGKKGRPAKHGRRLSTEEDFTLSDEKIGDYYIGVRQVLTNIFKQREVLAYVTAT